MDVIRFLGQPKSVHNLNFKLCCLSPHCLSTNILFKKFFERFNDENLINSITFGWTHKFRNFSMPLKGSLSVWAIRLFRPKKSLTIRAICNNPYANGLNEFKSNQNPILKNVWLLNYFQIIVSLINSICTIRIAMQLSYLIRKIVWLQAVPLRRLIVRKRLIFLWRRSPLGVLTL